MSYNNFMKQKTIGLIFVGIAVIGWALFLIFPFLAIPLETKASASIASLVIAEVAFIIATLILGKEYIQKFRRLGRKSKKDNE